MKNLYFVIATENQLEQLIVVDAFVKIFTKTSKNATIFFPSPQIRVHRDLWQVRNFARKISKAAGIPILSLGANISDDCCRRESFDSFWKYMDECFDSYYGIETCIVVFPIELATSFRKSSYFGFHSHEIEGKIFNHLVPGEISHIDFSNYRQKTYRPANFIDERFKYISVMPKVFLPSWICSPSKNGKNTNVELERIQLSCLNSFVDKNPIRGAMHRGMLVKELAQLNVSYKEGVQDVA
jgi:hypothetical protein